MSLLIRLPALIPALALLGGCATVDSTIAVAHEKPIAATHLKVTREVSVETVRLAAAPGIEREGVKKNGYGQDSASIFTDPKPDRIVQQALVSELGRAGFNVGEASPNLIRVDIRQFFAEPEVGVWAADVYAVVDATVSVTLQANKVKRRFTGIGKITTMFWADGSYHDAFELALQDFFSKCVPELVRFFDAASPQRDGGSM